MDKENLAGFLVFLFLMSIVIIGIVRVIRHVRRFGRPEVKRILAFLIAAVFIFGMAIVTKNYNLIFRGFVILALIAIIDEEIRRRKKIKK